jgi:phytoene dehydrogenase-like protein
MLKPKYDCVIIGAGMSGLAAGIRLSMYNKKVVILEKHTITGGLNSYYARGKRKFDVGLHALTNFVEPTERGRPFNKLLKQLRIPYEDFKLHPQNYSIIQFPDKKLKFTN